MRAPGRVAMAMDIYQKHNVGNVGNVGNSILPTSKVFILHLNCKLQGFNLQLKMQLYSIQFFV